MIITDIVPQQIIVRLELTIDEVDAISLALSKSNIIATSEGDKQASQTLTAFAEMLNALLERMSDESARERK